MDVVEGTLYPLLLRLKSAGHLSYEWRETQSAGPPRKYYKITPEGLQFLNELKQSWQEFTDSVNKIIGQAPTTLPTI